MVVLTFIFFFLFEQRYLKSCMSYNMQFSYYSIFLNTRIYFSTLCFVKETGRIWMTKIKVFSSNAISDKVFGPSFASNIIHFNTKQKTGEKLKEETFKTPAQGKKLTWLLEVRQKAQIFHVSCSQLRYLF